ncbi:hypothetical protein PRN20_06025 [Devosia sp. ZB163]|uniref:hypothetical protein n=1 Tax=Devosia sp. ZB163 TaxID=3025938 RepID=UPI0023605B5F|nr:hypothetical protein [Devosia sp. ZB163]MDC9823282.1 hypothetical protein [Devosia sp. ZB163]
MAEYPLRFSVALDTGTAANAAEAIALYAALASTVAEDFIAPGFVVGPHPALRSSTIWIHDLNGRGDPERVVTFVTRCAELFGLEGKWGFQWANTCSEPLLDAFGGGALVLNLATGEVVDAVHTDAWLPVRLDDDAAGDAARQR